MIGPTKRPKNKQNGMAAHSLDRLVGHVGLYRAKLNCKIGRDALEGKKKDLPCEPTDYALFCLLHAVEEIADAMQPNEKGQARRDNPKA